jgi:WD40 repeat protein
MIERLPTDILFHFLHFLDAETVLTFECCSRFSRILVFTRERDIWRSLSQAEFGTFHQDDAREATRYGYRLLRDWTKGNYAFDVLPLPKTSNHMSSVSLAVNRDVLVYGSDEFEEQGFLVRDSSHMSCVIAAIPDLSNMFTCSLTDSRMVVRSRGDSELMFDLLSEDYRRLIGQTRSVSFDSRITDVCLSADQKFVVVSCRDGSIRARSLLTDDEDEVKASDKIIGRHLNGSIVHAVACSGSYVASLGDFTWKVWMCSMNRFSNKESWELVCERPRNELQQRLTGDIAINDMYIAMVDTSLRVSVFSTRDWKCLYEFPYPGIGEAQLHQQQQTPRNSFCRVLLHHHLLLISSPRGAEVVIWDLFNGRYLYSLSEALNQPVLEPQQQMPSLSDMVLSRDGTSLILSSFGGTLYHWTFSNLQKNNVHANKPSVVLWNKQQEIYQQV